MIWRVHLVAESIAADLEVDWIRLSLTRKSTRKSTLNSKHLWKLTQDFRLGMSSWVDLFTCQFDSEVALSLSRDYPKILEGIWMMKWKMALVTPSTRSNWGQRWSRLKSHGGWGGGRADCRDGMYYSASGCWSRLNRRLHHLCLNPIPQS